MYTKLCMYFSRKISENKDGKKNEGSYLSCVTNDEFYFSMTDDIDTKSKAVLRLIFNCH